jgi:hypothetical protein
MQDVSSNLPVVKSAAAGHDAGFLSDGVAIPIFELNIH